MPVRVAVFDAMGTVFDQTPIRERLVSLGAPPGALEAWFERVLHTAAVLTLAGEFRGFEGIARSAARTALAQLGLDEAAAEEAVESLSEMRPFPDTEAALDRLDEAGVPAAILTNGGRQQTEQILADAGILGRFRRVFAVEEVGAYKPDPRPYRHALAQLQVEAGQATMIAAHGWDVVGARAVGMNGVWVDRLERRWPLPLPEPPRAGDLAEAAALVLDRADVRVG